MTRLKPVLDPLPRLPDRLPPAPQHLQPETQAWWRSVVAQFVLEEHHLRLLQAAAESWDQMQAARAAIREHGMTFEDQHGCPKTRPEVAIERDAKTSFRQLIRELDLDLATAPEQSARPPALRGIRR
jgi:P27 family predicted phage terminase small subunit